MATNVNLLDRLPDRAFWLVYQLLSQWENQEGLARPLWHDLSSNQGLNVNLDILTMNGALGFMFRAGISYGYQDKYFPSYWLKAEATQAYRTSYHVPYTDQSLIAQLDNWYRVHPEPDHRRPIPRVIDLEVNRPDTAAHKADFTWEMVEKIEQRDGMKPWLYSRYLLINAWLSPYWTVDMMNSIYYDLAQYLYDRVREHPGDPTLPNKVSRGNVIMQQTADKKAPPPGSVESYALDYQRWERGTEQDMHQFLRDNYGAEPPATWGQEVNQALFELGGYQLPPPPEGV